MSLRGSQIVINLSRPFTAASAKGSVGRPAIANGVSWSSSTVDVDLRPSHPTTPSAGGAEKDSNSPGFGFGPGADDFNPQRADYRRMACDVGSSSALCRPYTASNAGTRVSIYAPAPALKKHFASPKHGTPDNTHSISPKDQSNSSPRMLTNDASAALRMHSQAPVALRAASSHGTPGFPTSARHQCSCRVPRCTLSSRPHHPRRCCGCEVYGAGS